MQRKDLIQRLKNIDIIYKSQVNLKHDGPSDYYIDIKKAYGYPDILNLICDLLWQQIDKRTTCIATSGFGGLSPATLISFKHNLNLILVRDRPKEWGKNTRIDGYTPNENDKVSIIDDVLTTGGSLRECTSIITETNAEIMGYHVVVKRGYGDLDGPLHYLLTPEDLLNNG